MGSGAEKYETNLYAKGLLLLLKEDTYEKRN